MSNYKETKKELDSIRSAYNCKGDVIFRTAIQYVMDCGQQNFQDEDWVKEQLDIVDRKHDAFDRENKTLFISREFEKAMIECAAELAKVNTYDLLIYIQREVWLAGDGISYQRAIELLKRCMCEIEQYTDCQNELTYESFDNVGFTDDEIAELGFGYLVEYEEEQ